MLSTGLRMSIGCGMDPSVLYPLCEEEARYQCALWLHNKDGDGIYTPYVPLCEDCWHCWKSIVRRSVPLSGGLCTWLRMEPGSELRCEGHRVAIDVCLSRVEE